MRNSLAYCPPPSCLCPPTGFDCPGEVRPANRPAIDYPYGRMGTDDFESEVDLSGIVRVRRYSENGLIGGPARVNPGNAQCWAGTRRYGHR
jgi:hypothetical protein